MYRIFASTLILCCLTAVPTSHAQEEAAGPSGAATGVAVVNGLAEGDLLNIRERPSPLGRTLGKLPNGAIVHRHECEVLDGYEWCYVVALEAEELNGWTPARYLLPVDTAGEGTASVDASSPLPAMPGELSAETGATPMDLAAAPDPAIPDGLEARFAGEPNLPAAADRAFEDALLAAGAASLRQPRTAAPDATGQPAGPAMPVPTPRPDATSSRVEASQAAAGDDSSATSAPTVQVEPASAPPQAETVTGEIPCARYVGQPMTRCEARAVRMADDAADVTVIWPDGGTRVVEFRDGVPAGSNSRGEFRFTREGSLDMIRIGVSERFEIPSELSFGD